ncbi:hypothetical protein [Actinopolymorpha alba]|uniref:hypothetical protein n=1 Tax=Actinopolymorpha alba TaxID=533267 RepID=UPI0003A33E66|nr:hypothetical protein [Actinopolymorpha alba]
MLLHPDIMAMLAHDRERGIVTAAERRRLLTAARRARRAYRTRRGTNAEVSLGAVGVAEGTLSRCRQRVVEPAR